MFLLPKTHWTIKDTPTKGKGVFATEDISAGMVIGDYIGRVIDAEEDDKYEAEYGFYLMYYTDDATVIPDFQKDGVHLVNHSCTPNVGFYTYKGHTIYFTLRKIFKGEEITVSYQLPPEDQDCNPCEHICYCGSFVCQKTWHLSEDQYNKWEQFDDTKTKETQTEQVEVGKTLPPLSSYPQIIPDYHVYTLFGSDTMPAVEYMDTQLPDTTEIRSRIRETGRYASFPKVGITVYGVADNQLVTNKKSSQLQA